MHKNIIPIFYLSCNENGVLGYQTMTTRRVHDLGFWNFPQPPLCRFGRRIRLLIGWKYGVSVTELTLLSSGGIYFSIAALIVREGNKGSLYDFVDFSCFPLYMVGLFLPHLWFRWVFSLSACYCLKSKSSFSSLKSIIICVCFTENIFANLDFFLVFFYGFSCCTYSLFALPPQSSHFKLISQLNTLGNLEDWVWGDALFPRVETIVKRSGELFKKVT